MKKGTAMEGFIRDDGTIRPIEHYDDTELRGKIQTNTDNINNLDSRVTELEEHGGVEDPTKADKVENATAGNLASLDENGNLQDSGKKSSDFAAAVHGHKEIRQTNSDDELALVSATANEDGDLWIDLVLREVGEPTKTAQITYDNIDNLKRALRNPSSTPEDDTTKLITSKAVYDALLGKMANLRSMRITYNNVDDEFVVSESDKAVLVAFRNSAPADTFVPVLVSLYDGNTKDSDVFGLAKWSEEQQPNAIDINILVVIGNYYFSVNGDYQEIEDIRFTGWTRTVKGQSFFS